MINYNEREGGRGLEREREGEGGRDREIMSISYTQSKPARSFWS